MGRQGFEPWTPGLKVRCSDQAELTALRTGPLLYVTPHHLFNDIRPTHTLVVISVARCYPATLEESPRFMYDFHTHTFLSDGVLSPVELIRRAYFQGYKVIAITDHVGFGNVEYVVKVLTEDCRRASQRWDILAIPGVEITHVPKEDIDMVARDAKAMGAKLVNVHGETIVEPVEPGTNLAAISSTSVDILAHPGLLTDDEARIAGKNSTFL